MYSLEVNCTGNSVTCLPTNLLRATLVAQCVLLLDFYHCRMRPFHAKRGLEQAYICDIPKKHTRNNVVFTC